ncbi:MAG: TlpA family protein disulfide reductase [Candidatus Eremiobacteraeota bacterium]|nr:TlpA family protein disulfide reductase [Candidatus Eremiobacteraeota bacterium]MBV8372597.1 TlpA family protein disulfide reductase [Candidatus Eremiobacteraeota bacterium]
MNRSLLWSIVAVVGVIIVAIVAPLFMTGAPHPAGPAGLAGENAPIVALRDDSGAAASLERYRGKVVVMNLWATWCPPCRAEMPELQRFADTYGARGVVVVGVNQGESAQRARAFATALKIRFPIWLDDRQEYGRAFAALGLPTTVVVGRDGVVAGGYDGALTLSQMRAAVAGLVAH